MSKFPTNSVPLDVADAFSFGAGQFGSSEVDPTAQSSLSYRGSYDLQPQMEPVLDPRRPSQGSSGSEECLLEDPFPDFSETDVFQPHCHYQYSHCPPPDGCGNLCPAAPASSSDDGSQPLFHFSSQQTGSSNLDSAAYDLPSSAATSWGESISQGPPVHMQASMQLQDFTEATESQAMHQFAHRKGNRTTGLPPASTLDYGQENSVGADDPQDSARLSYSRNHGNEHPFPYTAPPCSDHNPNLSPDCLQSWIFQQMTEMERLRRLQRVNDSRHLVYFQDRLTQAPTSRGWPSPDVPQDALTKRTSPSTAGPRGFGIHQAQGSQKPHPVPIARAHRRPSPRPSETAVVKKPRTRILSDEGRKHAKGVRAVGACTSCRHKKIKCSHVLNEHISLHTNSTAQSAQGGASMDPSRREEGQAVHSKPESSGLLEQTSQKGTTDASSMDVQHTSDEMTLRGPRSLVRRHTSPFPMTDGSTISSSQGIRSPYQLHHHDFEVVINPPHVGPMHVHDPFQEDKKELFVRDYQPG